jgi:hypothetical protein
MGTINPNKTANVTLLAHSRVVHPDTVKGTELDVSGDYVLGISFKHGYVEDAADTNPGKFVVWGSRKTSGDDDWSPIMEVAVKGTDPDKVNFNASEAAGQTDLTVDGIVGLATGDLLYLQDTNGGSPSGSTGALASPETLSEWAYLRKASGTTLTVLTGIVSAKDVNDDVYNDASVFSCDLDVSAWSRIRVDFVHEGATGANGDVLVLGERLIEHTTA